MLKNTSYRAKKKVAVNLQLADGTLLDGFVFCNQGERVSDVFNDAREFLPFETHTSDIMMLRKGIIGTILARDTKEVNKILTDPFAILGIEKGADQETAKRAYHNKVRTYHPDKLASLDLPEDMETYANDMLARINTAYSLVLRKIETDRAQTGEQPQSRRSS